MIALNATIHGDGCERDLARHGGDHGEGDRGPVSSVRRLRVNHLPFTAGAHERCWPPPPAERRAHGPECSTTFRPAVQGWLRDHCSDSCETVERGSERSEEYAVRVTRPDGESVNNPSR
jgi:hypothetical protein